MKLVLEHPSCKQSVVIEQRTDYSKYVLSYYGYTLYNCDTGEFRIHNGIIGKFDTIEELMFFIQYEERQYPWFIDKIKKEFNID